MASSSLSLSPTHLSAAGPLLRPSLTSHQPQPSGWPLRRGGVGNGARLRGAAAPPPRAAYKVTIEHAGETRTLEVEEDETILGRLLDEGVEVPHDCKLGVCMTCPARLVSGAVDQSDGMLSDDVVERGYALLCAAYPRSDCVIRTIPEEELLSLQLATAND